MTENQFICTISQFPFRFDYETHDLLNGEIFGVATHQNVRIYYQSGLPLDTHPWRIEVYHENTHENLQYEATARYFIDLFVNYHDGEN